MTQDEIKYLNELAAEIVSNGDINDGFEAAIKAAHQRRQKFLSEMIAAETSRAKLARKAMMASVYYEVKSKDAINRLRHEVANSLSNANLTSLI